MAEVTRKGFKDKNGKQVVLKDPTKADKVPGATSGNIASFDEEGNLQDSGIPAERVEEEIHVLEFKDGSYESRMYVGQLNRDDDELDGATIYGKDAIRIATTGGRVYIDAENLANLQCALLGPSIAFVRDENDDYVIDSELKVHLNNLIEKMPADKCVPCRVYARWWNDSVSNYDSGYFPGALCRHNYTTPGFPKTIFLSFLGNLFFASRTANNDFPNTWTKFENPFATV